MCLKVRACPDKKKNFQTFLYNLMRNIISVMCIFLYIMTYLICICLNFSLCKMADLYFSGLHLEYYNIPKIIQTHQVKLYVVLELQLWLLVHMKLEISFRHNVIWRYAHLKKNTIQQNYSFQNSTKTPFQQYSTATCLNLVWNERDCMLY
jgi:hypothetical protein